MRTAYYTAENVSKYAEKELGTFSAKYGCLYLTEDAPRDCIWAQNIWYQPEIIEFSSISEGAKKLKSLQRNWSCYSWTLHRRAQLLQEQLPKVSSKPLHFLDPLPQAPLGSWTLLDEHRILASVRCSSSFPNGTIKFVEDKLGPPNRAYLKLWEFFTLSGRYPQKGEVCLEAGSSPGGWTWVLQKLGAKVISVDRAELDPRIRRLPGIEHHLADAFSFTPERTGTVDWLFSDLACTPDKLLVWAKKWIESGACRNFVCTIKLRSSSDTAIFRDFIAVRGAKLRHLFHNKHEVTWYGGKDFG